MQTVTVKLTDSASQLLVAQLPTDFINAMAPPCPASQVPQLPTEGKHKPICIYIYIYNIIYIYPPLKSGVDAHSHGRHARNWGNSSCYVGQSWSVHILAPVLSLSQTCWALRLCAKGCLAALRSYEWDPMNQPISTTMLPFAFGWCMKQELCCPKM